MGLDRKMKYGMVGGGPGSFIGGVHRAAIALQGDIELVAGAFATTAEKSKQTGSELRLDPGRIYGSYEEMAKAEAKLPEGERIDFVSIVTPTFTHFPIAKAFIEAGINVVCDKPMTKTLEEAEELCRLVKKHDVIFALTHNYTGYPMVKQAKALVDKGILGDVRKVIVEYPQGWLSTRVELDGNAKQAIWRMDPERAGVSACIGDIGSHAENLARYITGLEIEEMCADLTVFLPDRPLDDDGNILVHYKNGARGILYASMISVGEENNLRIRIYGTKAGMSWHQEDPNYLYVRYNDKPEEIYKRGEGYLEPVVGANMRLPQGHPEGFFGAFANVYKNAVNTMRAKITGEKPSEVDLDFPTVQDGAYGVNFIHKAVESSKQRGWLKVDYTPPK